MATTTTDITIVDSTWTEIAGSPSATIEGYFTLFGDSPVVFRQGESAPLDSVETGHWLEPASDFVRFKLLAGEKAYARAEHPVATLIVTLDG